MDKPSQDKHTECFIVIVFRFRYANDSVKKLLTYRNCLSDMTAKA